MMTADLSQQAFPETRWSLVRRAGGDVTESRRALEEICRSYWRPLYAFARRSGHAPEVAEDLTQEFLVHLLSHGVFEGLNEDGGKLRSFLLRAFRNFTVDQHRRDTARKRGGNECPVPLDTMSVEGELAHGATPDEAFEKNWALDLLDEAMNSLREEYQTSGKESVFTVLQPVLQGGAGENYRALGDQLGLAEGAVKVAVYRLRKRFREHLERVILETVEGPDEVAEELDFVRTVLSRG